MAKERKPECACGDISGISGGKRRIIFPCAGTANVGQISNLAAFQLTDEGYGTATCIALLAAGDMPLKSRIDEAEEVVVLDGCPVTCGAKIAAAQGISPNQHIVITGLGIEKLHSREYSDEDIEKVVSAAWEGKGRSAEAHGGVHLKGQIEIEWKHIGNDVTGTCERCSLTGDAIREVIEDLASLLDEAKVTVRFRETVLPDSRIEESNQVLINGIPLEDYLAGSTVVQTPCCSCACITGQDEAECRAIEVGGDRYEAIPAGMLKQVIVDLVGAMEREDEACACECGCGMSRKQE